MNPVVCHLVSGDWLFSGCLVLLLSVGLSLFPPGVGRFRLLAAAIGVILVVASSTPTPVWLVCATGMVLAGCLGWPPGERFQRPIAGLAIGLVAVVAIVEWPFRRSPRIEFAQQRTLTVIGDSFSAGLGNERGVLTWPKLFERDYAVRVRDLSHVSETAGSALKRLQSQQPDGAVIIVEIGGNDLKGSTSATDFSQALDQLLARVSGVGSQVLMFELPLPPFKHASSHAQRSLARKHGVRLIPKRVLLNLLSKSNATLDSIHLTSEGHAEMSEIVWKLVEPGYESQPSDSADD